MAPIALPLTSLKAVVSSIYFPAFLGSQFFSKIADQILLFIVPLVVYQTTQDIGLSGLAFALETLPRFLSFPICGALCDRISPVRLLHWSQVTRALVCLAGAALGLAFDHIGWLVGVSAVCGVLTTQGGMAREVILPQAFKKYRFEKVLAYSQTADQLGAVLGPLLAATLLTLLSWPWVVAGTAVIFIIGDGAMAVWRRTTRVEFMLSTANKGFVRAMKTGITQITLIPELRKLVIQAAGVNLVVGVTLASSAALFTGTHGQSDTAYGLLQAAGAVGTVVTLLGIAHTSFPLKNLGLVAFTVIVAGGFLTAIGAHFWVYVTGYLLVIGFDKMFNIYLRSSRQKVIPATDFGKTTGVMTLLNNLTQPLAGLAISAFSAQWTANNVIFALTMGMVLLGGISVLASRRVAVSAK